MNCGEEWTVLSSHINKITNAEDKYCTANCQDTSYWDPTVTIQYIDCSMSSFLIPSNCINYCLMLPRTLLWRCWERSVWMILMEVIWVGCIWSAGLEWGDGVLTVSCQSDGATSQSIPLVNSSVPERFVSRWLGVRDIRVWDQIHWVRSVMCLVEKSENMKSWNQEEL